MTEGVLLLCAMILSPQEMCVEKARYMYQNGIPLVITKVKNDWITEDVLDDIAFMKNRISQKEIAALYCMTESAFSWAVKRAKYRLQTEEKKDE